MRCSVVTFAALTAGWAVAASTDVARTPVAVPVVPNLRVRSIGVQRTGLTAAGAHQVRVTAQVTCASPVSTSVGAFALLVEYRDAGGVYHSLGESSIPRIACGAAANARMPIETRAFTDTVPAGIVRTYRATVDRANAIAEGNETDNSSTIPYAATGCPGVDLELTRVVLDRSHDGASVLVQAWVRNRCLQDCVGDIAYVINPVGGDGVEQGIAVRINGETLVGPLGTTAVGVGAGGAFTATVRIETRGGGCTDPTPGNNACLVSLPASVDSKSFTCNAISAVPRG
jgi:hypothetical protein